MIGRQQTRRVTARLMGGELRLSCRCPHAPQVAVGPGQPPVQQLPVQRQLQLQRPQLLLASYPPPLPLAFAQRLVRTRPPPQLPPLDPLPAFRKVPQDSIRRLPAGGASCRPGGRGRRRHRRCRPRPKTDAASDRSDGSRRGPALPPSPAQTQPRTQSMGRLLGLAQRI